MAPVSNRVLGPIRPITGAASTPGPEMAMVQHFVKLRLSRLPHGLILIDVPLPGGIVDILEMRTSAPLHLMTLATAGNALNGLSNHMLFLLARLPRGRAYRRETLEDQGWTRRSLDAAVDGGALLNGGHLYRRPSLLPDLISDLIGYEVKLRDPQRAVIQAARQTTALHRSYVVLPRPKLEAWSERVHSIIEHAGIGVVDAHSGRTLRASTRKAPGPWARFLAATIALRAISRELASRAERRASERSAPLELPEA